jgi:hypothetical protein
MGECLRQEFSEKPWVWHHPNGRGVRCKGGQSTRFAKLMAVAMPVVDTFSAHLRSAIGLDHSFVGACASTNSRRQEARKDEVLTDDIAGFTSS